MSNLELLPLPNSGSGLYEDNVWHDTFSKRQMEAFARANVAHATEAMKAEIEALRAVRDSFQRVGIAAQARAERLEEALRAALECGDDGDWQSARRYITEALHPTAAQENDNA